MCNPRRIRVSASRQIDEAWQHEVSRTVELSATVTGEARVRQPLGTELSGQTLRALEVALAAPDSGWVQIENGYRMTVEDPEILSTGKWSAAFPMKLDNDYKMYEYACHEGNTAIRNYIETSRFERANKKK